jgi:hypothetical protein
VANIFRRAGVRGTRYVARVRIVGHPVQVMTFERKTDAREWAQQVEADLRRNRNVPQLQHQRKTLGELIERYRGEGMPASCAGAYGPHLEWWMAKLGGHRLRDIDPELIAKLRDELSRERGTAAGGAVRRRSTAI